MSDDDLLEKMLSDRLEIGDGWLGAPTIQRAFRERFGSIEYKAAMDRLRERTAVEHRYVQEGRKKFWTYRLASATVET